MISVSKYLQYFEARHDRFSPDLLFPLNETPEPNIENPDLKETMNVTQMEMEAIMDAIRCISVERNVYSMAT